MCSPRPQKARALYACKAEHESELSFTAGAIFEDGKVKEKKQSKPVVEHLSRYVTVRERAQYPQSLLFWGLRLGTELDPKIHLPVFFSCSGFYTP